MKRKQRTEILIRGRAVLAADLAEQIRSTYALEVIEDPNEGLVMVKMRENAQNFLFYIGEVYVTECKVRLQGIVGVGIVRGHQPELATNLAIIDAAYRARLTETADWLPRLQQEQEDIQQQEAHQTQLLRATQVNFETMEEQLE
jgi:alpha-D-ribose 1-methylphosphonate 5-triphosphate synthase subunit PhnG